MCSHHDPARFAANSTPTGNNAIKPGAAASSPHGRESAAVTAAQIMIAKGL
jgi:hypothetical protein